MKIQSPSLVELHAFLAVYRLGSFRRAAEELCVTQAAVSRAVQRLEEHLGGCRLFDRSPAGVAPTEHGRQYRGLTARHVAALESAAAFFTRDTASQQVQLSVIATLGTQWLMPRLPAFQAAHPEAGVVMRQFRHDEDFTREDVDLWIDLRRPRRPWPAGLQGEYLLGRDIVPVCAPALAARLRRPADLAKQVLLHHSNYPDNWMQWFDAMGLPGKPRLGPGFDLSINIVVAARAGMGAAILQPSVVERELREGELVVPFPQPVSTNRGYYLCHRTATPVTKQQQAFMDWVRAEAHRTERLEAQAGLRVVPRGEPGGQTGPR